ncbi:hypothetical protein UFOVP393_14 [uncultured Caudovirales phage]|jgi:hypothetical protein|uniref:Uncharacterized protein n=1 Tax=uncultured Caudovirales phage TaxID=2100421 RepID=A0A6J7X665_9CAUD|nr:hypothetical protein UFOVP393_14 [uncultured Caudovirales phage]
MSILQTLVTSFKQQILLGEHDLLADTLKMALFTANANLNTDTTVYDTTNEIVGGGYTAGGVVLVNVTVLSSGSTAYVSFDNAVWNPAGFTARCALVYNSSKSNKAIAVIDFGSDKSSNPVFTVQMPPNTASSAIIRIA